MNGFHHNEQAQPHRHVSSGATFPAAFGIQENVPMRAHTTFRVGGPADYFAQPSNPEILQDLLAIAQKNGMPCTVVGGGTNLLVKDHGIRGLVISLVKLHQEIAVSPIPKKNGISVLNQNPINNSRHGDGGSDVEKAKNNRERYLVTVAAGAPLGSFCKKTMAMGLEDLSFAAGIPGTVGGAIMMNAGTGMGTISTHLHTIDILDYTGNVQTLTKSDLSFSHRKLAFPASIEKHDSGNRKNNDDENGDGRENGNGNQTGQSIFSPISTPIILNATFMLQKGDKEKMAASWKYLMDRRKSSQPHGVASAGCFFKNPDNGNPAGWLIDKAGLKKRRVGGAMVSDIHANFIINTGNATAQDILTLQHIVREKIESQFGVTLSAEVVIKGE